MGVVGGGGVFPLKTTNVSPPGGFADRKLLQALLMATV